MRQALHILAKDTRRCWPFLAVTLALTAALTYLTPRAVPLGSGGGERSAYNAVLLLQMLLPTAWWFTVARLVHGEPLVGDRQFWVTRPYSWVSLLSAKVLAGVAYLLLPVMVSDCLILWAEGFPVLENLPGLFWRMGIQASVLLLPAFLLAALTKGMGQFVLGVLGGFGYFVLLGQLAQDTYIPLVVGAVRRATLMGFRGWIDDWGYAVLFVGGGLAATLWQFARRRTVLASALAAALGLAGLAIAARPRPIIAAPSSPEHPEFTMRFAAERGRMDVTGVDGYPGKVQVDLPIAFAGHERETFDHQLASVCLTPEAGESWCSPFSQSAWSATRKGSEWIELHLAPPVFERLRQGRQQLRATVAAILYEPQLRRKVRLSRKWSEVPGVGQVLLADDLPRSWAVWRFSMGYPEGKLVYSISSPGEIPPHRGQEMRTGPVWGHLGRGHFSLLSQPFQVSPGVEMRLPAEATMDVTLLRRAGHVFRTIQVEGIRLEDYVVSQTR